MINRTFKTWMMVLGIVFLIASVFPYSASATSVPANGYVYGIKLEGTVDDSMLGTVLRGIEKAKKAGAKAILFEINTFGGGLDSAEAIGEAIRETSIPTAAFVKGKAVSAGSYIALNTGKIIMEPGSSIGSAAVVDGSGKEVSNPKVVSHWASEMRSAAELRGRDPKIAEGMADKNTVVAMTKINRTKQQGEIISLTAEEAVKVGYAEGTAANEQEALKALGLQAVAITWAQNTWLESVAEFLTSPFIMTILLLIGIVGLGTELLIPGFGFPGVIGVICFGIYFFGHYLAGFAGMEHIVMFIAGILLLVSEIFIPSFGILGLLGILSLGGGIVLAARDTDQGLWMLGISAIVGIVLLILIVKYFSHRGVWHRFILKDQLTEEKGYSSTSPKVRYLGKGGQAVTPLRPAGSAMIDGDKVDVVTDGEFIAAGSSIVVIQVEGVRVVVREVKEQE